MEYIIIIIFIVFVNNIVFAQFLGICPLLGVSTRISTATGMAGAVLFVMTLSTIATWLVQRFILDPFHIGFLQTIAFILVIAGLVQMVEIILKKVSPSLYQALGIYLPLITTNCTVLAVAIQTITRDLALLPAVVFAISNALGFGLALLLFAGIREHLALVGVPKGMQGVPIALVIAGILSMAFMGFANLVSW
ncbi:MAG: RnfABCDGE type electron transport complex subunit A [Bacteroidales bacterium]|nr:RnfABCDGE type electron transport complex subunit A [Lentimicrobiaceae bacterium]MDD5695347.1 RnfABCDGE type electron transport complex subunit A [Bacteroidales bacterium]